MHIVRWYVFHDSVFLFLWYLCVACLNASSYFFLVYADTVWVSVWHVCIETLTISVRVLNVVIVALYVTNDEMDPNLDFDSQGEVDGEEQVPQTGTCFCRQQRLGIFQWTQLHW